MSLERGVRADWFAVMCYAEHIDGVRKGIEDHGYEYVAARHDRCIDKEGNLKQVHWHFVIIPPKAEYHHTLAKRLGLENRFVKPPKAPKPNGAVRYLIHMDNPEKVQYERDIVESNLEDAELDLLFEKLENNSKKSESEEAETLLADIERLSRHEIGFRAFLTAHPSFIYQAKSLLALVELASDWRWKGVDDNGEIR